METGLALDDATSSASLTFMERADAVNVASAGFGGGTTRLGAELAFQQMDLFHGGDNFVASVAVTGQNPSGNNGALPANAAQEGTQILGRLVYRPWSDGLSNVQFGGSAARLLQVADNAMVCATPIVAPAKSASIVLPSYGEPFCTMIACGAV